MKKKIVGIFVYMLLIVATVSPVAGTINNVNVIENQNSVEFEPQYGATSMDDEWPMLLHDLQNTGYSPSSLAPATNTVKWIFTAGFHMGGGPAVVNGKVYITTADNYFHCLDADTGEKLWSYYDDGFSNCYPAVYDGKVYVASTYDYFYCLDADTGSLIWKFYKGYRFSAPSPAVVGGKVYYAHSRSGSESGNASLYCLDADTGSKFWDNDMGYFEVSSPAVYNDKVYIGSEDYKLYCFDADTGSLLWDFETDWIVISAPTVFDGKVYFGSDALYCLYADTGNKLWSYPTGGTMSSPAVAYGNVYFSSYNETGIHCVDADTGSQIWYFPTSHVHACSPAVADGKVYNGIWATGQLLCLDATTGEKLWVSVLPGAAYGLFSAPAVAYGRLYFSGGGSCKLYCFEDPSQQPPNPPTINGPSGGKPGEEYDFTFVTTDPEGDDVYYYIDWDDGTNSSWIGPYPSEVDTIVSNIWQESGSFIIRAKAKDIFSAESDWSNFTVTMPRDKAVSNSMLLRILERFPLLQRLLDIWRFNSS